MSVLDDPDLEAIFEEKDIPRYIYGAEVTNPEETLFNLMPTKKFDLLSKKKNTRNLES